MKNLIRILIAITVFTCIGVGWFWLYEKWTLVDSVYMTVITLSTVGYTEVRTLSPESKVFICFFLVMGLGVFMYGIIQVGEYVVRAELGKWWRDRNMSVAIKSLENHFIVCGAGRMGMLLCEDLSERQIPFVVLDTNPEVVLLCQEKGWTTFHADATEDQSLDDAHIDRAAGLASTLATDADNLFVVMSARLKSSDIRIVARANGEASAKKLERAGANRVVSPYESGATKMGQLLTNPQLNDFFEVISDRNVSFDLAGIPVREGSPNIGKRLSETNYRSNGVMIVAILRGDDGLLMAPEGSTQLQEGDELFVLGNTDAINKLR